MPRLLIYDSQTTGHHSDYLRAVFDYANSRSDKTGELQLVFMVPEAMQGMLGAQSSAAPIVFRCLSEEQLAAISKLSRRKRSFLELSLIRKAVKDNNIDRVFLMNLDYFLVALASKEGKKTGCDISGILFQPYTRFEKVATEHRFLPGEYLRALRKRLRLSALLRNKLVKRHCVPCDQAAVDKLAARHGHRVQVDMLPEPYFAGEVTSSAGVDIRANYNIAPHDRIVLVFGHIIARKNVPNLLRALQSSCLTFKGGITLLIIGDARDAYRALLEQEFMQFNQTRASNRQVIFDCSFADTKTMDAAFAQTDLVAMPYFKAYQSSGILFLAARHGKPVITANVGLINELVNRYGLGKTADPLDADAIAAALEALLQVPLKMDASNEFFLQHTPEKHAACVLGI